MRKPRNQENNFFLLSWLNLLPRGLVCAIACEQFLILQKQIRFSVFRREVAGALRSGDGIVKFSRFRISRRERAEENGFFKMGLFAGALRELNRLDSIANFRVGTGGQLPRQVVEDFRRGEAHPPPHAADWE